MSKEMEAKIVETAEFLRNKGVDCPKVGIILGSGLNDYADRIENQIVMPYETIPHFHKGEVASHRGELVFGDHMGKKVVVLAGRFHYYECCDMEVSVFPVRVLIELGIKRLIITNAAGSINYNYPAGQLMVIRDHINLSGTNPLMGPNYDKYGERFPDMTYLYNRDLRSELIKRAAGKGIVLVSGVYVMMSGPSFETPAEIRFLRTIGGDAVGMSTVPEAIVANHAGLEVIGISLLGNMAAGMVERKLSGDEVIETGIAAQKKFAQVVDLALSV